MNITQMLLVAAASGTLAVSVGATPLHSSASVAPQQEATQDQQSNNKKEMVATIVAVNRQRKTIKVDELPSPISITPNTVFDEEVQFAKLKAGAKVKLVLTTNSEGGFEAAEVHSTR